MKLTDLNPRWMAHGGDGVTRDGQPEPRREKIGLSLDCPCGCGCRCMVTFDNPEDGAGPVKAMGQGWMRVGTTFETLTLSPSIQRAYPGTCMWHGFIENGAVRQA